MLLLNESVFFECVLRNGQVPKVLRRPVERTEDIASYIFGKPAVMIRRLNVIYNRMLLYPE